MILESARRWNTGCDAAAAVLLCGALVLPWNLYFGVGVPGSEPWLFAALGAATALSLLSIGVRRMRRADGALPVPHPPVSYLHVPYLLLVCAVVVVDVVQTVRYGGSAHPPGGVGPGAWLGVAGALLAARADDQAADRADHQTDRHTKATRGLGYAAIGGAGLSVLFNLYWRVRYALPEPHSASGFGKQHAAIIVTALVYGAVAWVTVYAASRWIIGPDKQSQLSTVALGGSTLVAGLLVWALPVGRLIDAFHGIAQNTSTAGVGFEGYLAWAAAAAILAVPALGGTTAAAWPGATRNTLLLIIVWCLGSALMRITDLIVAASLHLPHSPYDSATMAAFDVVTAVVAIWLRINLGSRSLPPAAIWSASAVLFGFTIARVMVGVGLAPRLAESQRAAALANPVYGNGLAQQITSTFDVTLCCLAFFGLAVAIVVGRLPQPKVGRPRKPRIFRTADTTRRIAVGGPKIYRGADDSAEHVDAEAPPAQGSSNGS